MIGNLVRTLLGAAIESFRRFPVTAVAIIVTAIIANLDIGDWLDIRSVRQEQIYSTLAAFCLLSLVKYIGVDSRGYGRLLQHAAALIGGAIVAALVWFAKDVGLSVVAFFAGLVGALLVSAHWFRGTSAALWFFIVRLLFAFGLALIAVVVFALGASAIFASLEYLFGIDVPGELYGHIWATSLIAAGPLFALGRIPEDYDTLPVIDSDNHAIAGLRLLSDFLAAPLLVIYALILHAYAAKIIISGEVPENQIGWMVIGFGALVIFFWKLMLPLREVLTLSGRFFLRVWPFMVIVPMVLLFYAIWLRIGEYGVTPERYFLVAFGVLMTLFALMQLVPRLRNWLPGAASLTVITLFLGGFGPWGAEMVSVKSQINQLASILDDKSQVVPGEGGRAVGILHYLRRRDALSGLKNIVGHLKLDPFKNEKNETNYKLSSRLEKAIGVDKARKSGDHNKGRRNITFAGGVVSVAGFDLHISRFTFNPSVGSFDRTEIMANVYLSVEKDAIVVQSNGVKTRFSLEPVRAFADIESSSSEAKTFKLSSGGKEILLVPHYLYLRTGGKIELKSGNGSVFLRSKDWQ